MIHMNMNLVLKRATAVLVGTHARDKDAIVAVMALCEAAAYYKN